MAAWHHYEETTESYHKNQWCIPVSILVGSAMSVFDKQSV